MPPKRKSNLKDIAEQTANYITTQLDATDWQQLLEQHKYCQGCPARSGVQMVGNDIDSLCLYCPLRPLMMNIADLQLRAQRKMPPREE